MSEVELVVVLARDAREFMDYCRSQRLRPHSRRVIYASDPAKVDGMRDFTVVMAPGWRLHPKATEIERVINRNLVKQDAYRRRWMKGMSQ